ncbi:MAG: Uma2 family endonuclease [Anaerolineae bacterium]|nr:Uma2 family endonuclease [Candidatus Roseilinea sp.]MDW8450452.1 Uma2 family endonuclease [Anaerolineae bacterium]
MSEVVAVSRVTRAGERVPPLENGDRLTRREFERRYAAMPHVKKAELIEGVVYMPSPLHVSAHAEPHAIIVTWLGVYKSATPGVRLADNATLQLDMDNEFQPDVMLFIDPALGGRARITDDDYIAGAPELIVEIAASSASIDVHDKLKVYRRSGVQEFLVWRTRDAAVDWWEMREGDYAPLPREGGRISSRVFPGLTLDVDALLRNDPARVLAALQDGLRSDLHASFIEQLRRRGSGAQS